MSTTLNSQQVSLILKSFSKALETNLPAVEIIGRLARKDFQTVVKIGDELDLIMPGEVILDTTYRGGTLKDPQYPGNTVIKISVNKGASIHFAIDNVKAMQMNAQGSDAATSMALIKEYTNNAVEKFNAAIEADSSALYTKAGYNLNSNTSGTPATIAYTSTNVLQLFTAMKKLFSRGQQIDGVWRPCWFDGRMTAVIPPELTEIIVASTRLQYTPAGLEEQEKGFITKIAGWKVYESPYITPSTDATPQYHPIFGVEGEALGSIIQKNLTIQHYIPPEGFDDTFKGYGLYGVDVARPDKLGTACITISYS